MNEESIRWAMNAGAPVTCATCKFFHEGEMRCGKTECGGPTRGRDFPSYDGPIPRDKFADRCLICGAGSVQFLIVGLPTKFALCKNHRDVFSHITANPGEINYPVRIVATP